MVNLYGVNAALKFESLLLLPRRLQGVSGGSPGRDGLPVVAAERDQEKLQTGEDRDGKDTEYV